MGGDVLVSSFLQPFTGGQGSLRQAIMYDYNNKSNEKQRLKSKKQIQHGVRFCSSLLQDQGAIVVERGLSSSLQTFPCILHGGRGQGALWSLFYKSTNPILEGSTLMT